MNSTLSLLLDSVQLVRFNLAVEHYGTLFPVQYVKPFVSDNV